MDGAREGKKGDPTASHAVTRGRARSPCYPALTDHLSPWGPRDYKGPGCVLLEVGFKASAQRENLPWLCIVLTTL